MGRVATAVLALPGATGESRAVSARRPRLRRLVRLADTLAEALRQIGRHRLRTSLALSGIAVGVAAVVGSLALVDGFAGLLHATWERFGGPRAGFVGVRDAVYKAGRRVRLPKTYPLTAEDQVALGALIPELERLSPISWGEGTVGTGRVTVSGADVRATGSDFPATRTFVVEAGRYFTAGEEARAERVAVLFRDFAEELFGADDPVGRELLVDGQRFVVVGIFPTVPSWRGLRRVFIPFRTALVRLGRDPTHTSLGLKLRPGASAPAVQDEIYRALLLRHPGATRDSFRVLFFSEFESRILKEIETQGDVVVAVALLCLLAGAVGVLNVFLISVTERTREIGLRLALGASRRGVLGQLLLEALVLCAIGGTAGLVLGTGVAALAEAALRSRMKPGTNIGSILDSDPSLFSIHVGARGVLLALGIVVATALAAGLYPAWRAARLDPAESLRHE